VALRYWKNAQGRRTRRNSEAETQQQRCRSLLESVILLLRTDPPFAKLVSERDDPGLIIERSENEGPDDPQTQFWNAGSSVFSYAAAVASKSWARMRGQGQQFQPGGGFQPPAAVRAIGGPSRGALEAARQRIVEEMSARQRSAVSEARDSVRGPGLQAYLLARTRALADLLDLVACDRNLAALGSDLPSLRADIEGYVRILEQVLDLLCVHLLLANAGTFSPAPVLAIVGARLQRLKELRMDKYDKTFGFLRVLVQGLEHELLAHA